MQVSRICVLWELVGKLFVKILLSRFIITEGVENTFPRHADLLMYHGNVSRDAAILKYKVPGGDICMGSIPGSAKVEERLVRGAHGFLHASLPRRKPSRTAVGSFREQQLLGSDLSAVDLLNVINVALEVKPSGFLV
jgi:hypothetical protein